MILNKNNVRVNNQDKVWLYQHGGRGANDAMEDSGGKFVLMSDGWGGEMKVYMPKSNDLVVVPKGRYKHYNFDR